MCSIRSQLHIVLRVRLASSSVLQDRRQSLTLLLADHFGIARARVANGIGLHAINQIAEHPAERRGTAIGVVVPEGVANGEKKNERHEPFERLTDGEKNQRCDAFDNRHLLHLERR